MFLRMMEMTPFMCVRVRVMCCDDKCDYCLGPSPYNSPAVLRSQKRIWLIRDAEDY